MPLSDAKLRTLKPAEKPFKIGDSGGLHVLVTPKGSKLWRLAYRYQGKQKLLAFGAYPAVSLREARDRRDAAKAMLEEGSDPSAVRNSDKLRARIAAGDTFQAVSDEWFASRKARWVKGYADRLRSRLEADLYPYLGKRPLASIQPIEVLDVIRRIEGRDAVETARRVMQIASAVFRYGVATSRCPRDPTVDVRDALRTPKPVKSRSYLKQNQLGEFVRKLAAYEGEPATRIALNLALLTFVRTGELRFAKWAEFEDLNGSAPLWRIPAVRMKMRRDHLVPLSPRVVELLSDLRRLTFKSEYLFPSATRTGVMSENTMLFAMYRLGYHGRATVHGFRSLASTVLNEAQFNRDWIEMQLAHVEGGVRAVYNAAEWLPGRREMMVWWASYVADAAVNG